MSDEQEARGYAPAGAEPAGFDAGTADSAAKSHRHSVLIVEDEAIVAQDLCEFLTSLDYAVVGIASRGADALRLAQDCRPEVILMDVGLNGDMDGIQTARAILAFLSVPIIFLTGQTDSDTLHRVVMAGPTAYIVKPFKDAELRAAIEIAMLKHQAEAVRVQREEALQRNAEYLKSLSLIDELTSLKNRRGFFALAEQELKVAHREQQTVVLFFIDLNGLKTINDQYGHSVGDLALRDAAVVLSQTFRESDILARLGGDEFVALTRSTERDVVFAVKRRLHEQLRLFNEHCGRPFVLDMSIGAAPVEDANNETLEALLARADAAMYEDKRIRARTLRATAR